VPVTYEQQAKHGKKQKQVKVTKRNTRYNLLKDLTRTSKLLFFVACHKKET
jgi:translation initiation factor IF-2